MFDIGRKKGKLFTMKPSDDLMFEIGKHYSFDSEVEKYFGLKNGEIKKRTNKREISEPRKISMWLQAQQNMVQFKRPRWSDIGRNYPGKSGRPMNHASIIHNVESVSRIMEVDKTFRKMIYEIQIRVFGEVKFKK
jgi:chromosomal replication initiation ATPase DnaA